MPQSVRLWEGQAIPPLKDFDLMFVLGGAQDVWETRNILGSPPRRRRSANGWRSAPSPISAFVSAISFWPRRLAARSGWRKQSEVGVNEVTVNGGRRSGIRFSRG